LSTHFDGLICRHAFRGLLTAALWAMALMREYWAALLQTPEIFRRVAFRKRTLEEELQEV
jgi:hypothetical protein